MSWPVKMIPVPLPVLDIGTAAHILIFLPIHEIIANNGFLLFKFMKYLSVIDSNLSLIQDILGIHHKYGKHIFNATKDIFIPEFLEWKNINVEYGGSEVQPVPEVIKFNILTYGPQEISHFLRVSEYSFLHEMIRFSINQLLEGRLLPFRAPELQASESSYADVPIMMASKNSPGPLTKIEMFLKALTTTASDFETNSFPAQSITKVFIAGSFVLKAILRQHLRVTFSPKDIDIYVELGKC